MPQPLDGGPGVTHFTKETNAAIKSIWSAAASALEVGSMERFQQSASNTVQQLREELRALEEQSAAPSRSGRADHINDQQQRRTELGELELQLEKAHDTEFVAILLSATGEVHLKLSHGLAGDRLSAQFVEGLLGAVEAYSRSHRAQQLATAVGLDQSAPISSRLASLANTIQPPSVQAKNFMRGWIAERLLPQLSAGQAMCPADSRNDAAKCAEGKCPGTCTEARHALAWPDGIACLRSTTKYLAVLDCARLYVHYAQLDASGPSLVAACPRTVVDYFRRVPFKVCNRLVDKRVGVWWGCG